MEENFIEEEDENILEDDGDDDDDGQKVTPEMLSNKNYQVNFFNVVKFFGSILNPYSYSTIKT